MNVLMKSHDRRSVKGWVRLFVVMSAIGPIAWVYRLLYTCLAKLAVADLKCRSGLIAVYLCRGLSKNKSLVIPGISDIDFIVVVKNGGEHAVVADRILRKWNALTFGVIEYYPAVVMTECEFERMWHTNLVRRFRFLEGQSTWTLMAGADVVNQLPELNELKKREAYYAELNYWWVRFVAMCFHDEAFLNERLLRNSICYKAVTEVSNLKNALQTGELVLQREDAFEREQGDLFERLKNQKESRCLTRDDDLVKDTLQFIMGAISDVWSAFSTQPFLTTHADIVQTTAATESCQANKQVEAMLEHFRLGFHRKFVEADLHVEVLQSLWWQSNELLVVVTLPAAFEIDAKIITDLIEAAKVQTSRLPRCFLYLRMGDVLFPLTPELPKDFYRGVITAATIPDVILRLGGEAVFWTDWSACLISGPEVERLWPSLTHQKRNQLNQVSEMVATGSICYSTDLSECQDGL